MTIKAVFSSPFGVLMVFKSAEYSHSIRIRCCTSRSCSYHCGLQLVFVKCILYSLQSFTKSIASKGADYTMNSWMRYVQKIPTFLQAILNVTLALVALTLCFFLLKETWHIFSFIFLEESEVTAYELAARLLVFFLYFEFIALIIKYFKSGFHFPLRYFIYIGITAIIRLIIVDYEKASNTVMWSLAILILLGALFLANSRPVRNDD